MFVFRRYTVVLGAHSLEEDEASQQRFSIARYIPHPAFGELENDIQLLKVSDSSLMFHAKHPMG